MGQQKTRLEGRVLGRLRGPKTAHDNDRNHEFPSETHEDFFKKSAFYAVKTPQESESCLASKKQNGKRIKYGMPFEKKAFSFRKQCRKKNDKHSASKAEKKTTSTLPQKQKRKRQALCLKSRKENDKHFASKAEKKTNQNWLRRF